MEVVIIDIDRKGLDIILNVDPKLPDIITGDVSRLRQIVVNLLSNAVKFSSHGEIVIRAGLLGIFSEFSGKSLF